MQYHPDLNPDDEKASQRFMEIKESYKGLRNSFSLEPTVLSDDPIFPELINDEKRKAYNDQIGFYHRWQL